MSSRFLDGRLRGLPPYVPGEQPKDGRFVKLNTNEMPFPPSPRVLEALGGDTVSRLNRYPDPEAGDFVEALARHYGVDPKNVLAGNGSDEILSFAFLAFFGGGKGAVFPDITYGFYPVYARLYGVPYKQIPLAEDFALRPEDYYGAGAHVVIANPNAPTGMALGLEEIEGILQANRDNLVIVDEAYVDFGAESALPLVKRYDNLLVVQTFSKSRALAGARLGFAVAQEEIIKDLNQMRCSTNPYNLDRMSLAVGVAALEDAAYYEACCRTIAQSREWTTGELRRLGFSVLESKANFLFAAHPAMSGEELYARLRQEGILVRHFAQPRIGDYIRITVGDAGQMEALIAALARILGEG